MLIPHDLLEAETLTRLLEDFVTRDGTDNGDETPLPTRVERARRALEKGQAVIGMIESTLGPDKFRAGIRRYMAKYKYGNTETDMLWTELEAASGMQVKSFAHDFTLQGGVPGGRHRSP